MGKCLGQGRIPLRGQLRKQMVAYPVTSKIQGRVAGILAPANRPLAQKAYDLRALDIDQRPDNAPGSHRTYGRQSRSAAAAQETEKYRFRLVGTGMSHRHPRGESAGEVALKEGQASVAGGLLQIARRRGEIQICKRKRQLESVRKTGDKLGVVPGGIAVSCGSHAGR